MRACFEFESLHYCKWDNRSSIFILFQHTFSSLVKQKPPKTSPTKSRGTMAVSMREVDSVFQGVGQKKYPSVSIFLLVTLSMLIPFCCFIARISCAIISLTNHYIISSIVFMRIFLEQLQVNHRLYFMSCDSMGNHCENKWRD